MIKKRVKPGPNQESVWDYPRPPRLEDFSGHIQIIFNQIVIADTHRARRVLETSHPPVYYIPPLDIKMEYLLKSGHTSWCEWKGQAAYFDLEVKNRKIERAGWYYPEPTKDFQSLKDYVAFYPAPMDACYVDGEKVLPQPGNFYGGWITKNIVGPFKGETGTMFW
jgi:uncharacterized protein (DUF427 family)